MMFQKTLIVALLSSYSSGVVSFSPSLTSSPAVTSSHTSPTNYVQFIHTYNNKVVRNDGNNNFNTQLHISSNNEEESRTMMSLSKFTPKNSFGADAVPEGQRPANEYLNLINSPMFGWAGQESGTSGLATRLVAVYAVTFGLVCWPIAGATFTQDGYLLQQFAAANVADLGVILAVLVRLYSGWGYVGSRLQNKFIEYEETGWYDGDFELKSNEEKARDLFLYRNDVQPVEERIKFVSLLVAGAFLLSCFGFKTAVQEKPLFDQYNPNLLERLNNDDKAAGVVSRQSNGRPTYCDSRYYRAVAGGGQGCD